MKIKSSNLNRLTRWEVFQLLSDALTFAKAAEASASSLYVARLNALNVAFEAFDKALVKERATSSAALVAAEDARDYAVRKLYALAVEYADYRFDAQKEAAALAVLKLFRPYGTGPEIARLPQDSETAILTNLLQDLETDTAAAHIAALGLEAVQASMKENNALFAEAQQERRKEQSEYVAGEVKSAREAAQEAFRVFCDTVNALVIVEGDENYARLVAQLNTLSDSYLSNVRQRQARKSGGTSDGETPALSEDSAE